MSEYYPLCPICGFELFAQAEKERGNAASALASMTEQRDAARKDAQEAVAAHGKLMEYYVADFSRLMSNNKELRELRQTCSDLAEERDQLKEKVRMLTLVSRHETLVAEAYRLENNIKEASKERDELNEKLATEMGIREQIQRNCDYADKQNLELRRQFDVVIDDRNILRARCDELERGDRHSCGVKCGRQEERRAVVAWLNKNPQGWARQWSLAGRIERGEHDV